MTNFEHICSRLKDLLCRFLRNFLEEHDLLLEQYRKLPIYYDFITYGLIAICTKAELKYYGAEDRTSYLLFNT